MFKYTNFRCAFKHMEWYQCQYSICHLCYSIDRVSFAICGLEHCIAEFALFYSSWSCIKIINVCKKFSICDLGYFDVKMCLCKTCFNMYYNNKNVIFHISNDIMETKYWKRHNKIISSPCIIKHQIRNIAYCIPHTT